jgi:hypothetical protein
MNLLLLILILLSWLAVSTLIVAMCRMAASADARSVPAPELGDPASLQGQAGDRAVFAGLCLYDVPSSAPAPRDPRPKARRWHAVHGIR